MSHELNFQIQKVRSRAKSNSITSAVQVDGFGNAIPTSPRYCIVFPNSIAPIEVDRGQVWSVSGDASEQSYEVSGYRVEEIRILARVARLLRPSGEHIVQLLSTNPGFPGIGEVTARRLWKAMGSDLYKKLDEGDEAAFASLVGEDRAAILVSGWAPFRNADLFQWLERVGLDLALSRKLLDVYGADTRDSIEADPYRLIAFGMSFDAADQLAKTYCAVRADDPRRLIAAIEHLLYQALDRGDTVCNHGELACAFSRLLPTAGFRSAMEVAANSSAVVISDDVVQATGPHIIESALAAQIAERVKESKPIARPEVVRARLEELQHVMDVTLTDAQRAAVEAALQACFLVITGGAGVGKTTVLRAVNKLLRDFGVTVYLMALSGRAARRMHEATQVETMTIAGFLRNVAPKGIPSESAIVVDEASMLDALLAYRIFDAIPRDCRVILIGDPAQLPPVGPGLTLHALVDDNRIHRVELTQVHRFGGAIADMANHVRAGRWPSIGVDGASQVSFLDATQAELNSVVLGKLLEHPRDTQILTFVREGGAGSANKLNALCQETLLPAAPQVLTWNADRGRVERSGFRLGDPVLCTKNLWDDGIQNGSLGRIEDLCAPDPSLCEGVYAWIRWDDGVLRPMTDTVLDSLELGYAITVHKAQGSQFSRVLIPIRRARNLDRAMLYTAITRATTSVVLVGDMKVAREIVEQTPSATRRKIALSRLLEDALCS